MCGIIGVVVNNNPEKVIYNLYRLFVDQKGRGMRGAGISIKNSDKLYRYRSHDPYNIFNIINWRIWRRVKTGSQVLFHHRFPTSSPNKPKFNHPIANENKSMHLIHNGYLYDFKRKDKHTYETFHGNDFTDSEILVHTFEDGYKGDIVEALRYMYDQCNGSFAIAVNFQNHDGIYLLRHINPIIISKDDEGNHYFSSECRRLKKVHELANGEIGVLKSDGYHKLAKMKTKPVKSAKKIKTIHGYNYDYGVWDWATDEKRWMSWHKKYGY